MGKICCVTGNRPQKFPWIYGSGRKMKKYLSDMDNLINDLIKQGYDFFISGGALGADQDFAESVLTHKISQTEICLEIAVPCRTQASRWSEAEQKRYNEILERADIVSVLSKYYTRFCMQKRNEYMVKKSDIILAFWNGNEEGGTWNTITYARKLNKRVKIYLLTENRQYY